MPTDTFYQEHLEAVHIQEGGETMNADIVLVSCVKTKRDAPSRAKDLYTSPLFRKERDYAEHTGLPWFILSAEYGLVHPDAEIAPYERYLPHETPAYRREWGVNVVSELERLIGTLSGKVIEIHAGATYLAAIRVALQQRGAMIVEPLQGLPMGKRMQWYGKTTSASDQALISDHALVKEVVPTLMTKPLQKVDEHNLRAQSSLGSEISSPDVTSLIAALRNEDQAISPTAFREAGRRGLNTPGLYSWWVDTEGAKVLSSGLGFFVNPGLIYAGLAGATHWPSGKRSSNTLWLRIATMHLGSKHEFSTFRRTLGAILVHAEGKSEIDENLLTSWMEMHLKVIAIPYEDADSLGRVEDEVLDALDPPLNIKGRPKTALRMRLSALRKIVTQ